MERIDPEVLRRQVAIYRAMSPERKLELSWALYLGARELRNAAASARRPAPGSAGTPSAPHVPS